MLAASRRSTFLLSPKAILFSFASFIIRLIMLLWHWHSIYRMNRTERRWGTRLSYFTVGSRETFDEWSEWRDHRSYSRRLFAAASNEQWLHTRTHNMVYVNVATNDNEWKMWRVYSHLDTISDSVNISVARKRSRWHKNSRCTSIDIIIMLFICVAVNCDGV